MIDFRCGTNAGYQAHLRKQESSCSDCSTAHRQYLNSRKHLYKGKYKESAAAYAKNNPEVIRKATAKWRKSNPELNKDRIASYHNVRRARKLSAESEPYTDSLILETFGSECHICLSPIDLTAPRKPGVEGWEKGLHLDHVVPLFKGGSNLISNIRPAHGICNIQKQRGLLTITEQ